MIRTWDKLNQAFLEQYSFNLDLIPKREDLAATRQRPHEPFREYVGQWRALASQVQDKPSDKESIKIIIRGAQPDTGALLSIQPITTFSSLICASAHVEGSLCSGSFPALSAFAKQATSPNHSSGSSSNNNSSNNNPRRRDPSKPAVAYVRSPATLINMVAQLGPSQVAYAPTPRTHTLQITPTAQLVYPAPPIRQGRPGQRRPQHSVRNFTLLVEPLSSVFPKGASLLRLPEVRPPPSPLPS